MTPTNDITSSIEWIMYEYPHLKSDLLLEAREWADTKLWGDEQGRELFKTRVKEYIKRATKTHVTAVK